MKIKEKFLCRKSVNNINQTTKIDYPPWLIDAPLPITGYRLPITDYRLPITQVKITALN